MSVKVVQIHPRDNVVVAIVDMKKGEKFQVANQTLTLSEDIAKGHKIALVPLTEGSAVYKYGYCIGTATKNIEQGSWVHSHNLKTSLSGTQSYTYEPVFGVIPTLAVEDTFWGYKRATGRVGIRNEIWIINTVGCVNKTAEKIAARANSELRNINFDGVFTFNHPYGCSQLGDDLENTKHILAALAQHPNAGGVLLLGLGCENNRLEPLLELIPPQLKERIRYFDTQEVPDEIETGLRYVNELYEIVKNDQRQKFNVSELVVGMKCGGSDGFSGITANPLVGRIAEQLSLRGSTVLLTEVPEMFGAEQELMKRAVSEEVFTSVVSLINSFKQYYIDHKQPVYENPSPGNKAGGITTLEEKSLGAIQKGGAATVIDVLEYGEVLQKLQHGGLVLLNAPGNDGVSTTAMTAAGAVLILFTTGRGTPLGAPVPTIKIATNSLLAQTKSQWIDFDAGQVVSEGRSMDVVASDLFNFMLSIASGEQKTKNEINGFKEIAIWKKGVTL